MRYKKFQHIFFASLLAISISCSLYLNLHIKQNSSTLVELSDETDEASETLMADIDAFNKLLENVAKQIVIH